MDWQTALQIYLIGIPVWAFVMSVNGERFDKYYVGSALIWPIAAISFAGQLVRYVLGKKPFK